MKTIYQTSDIGQMTVVKSVLESAGINCVLLDEYTQILRPATLQFSGGGRLAVEDEKEEEALELLADYLKTVNTEEESINNSSKCPECGSTEYEPAFWSVFFNGNNFKCNKCGAKFKI
ncbi:MAG: DUF2007 domain-containing protein [Candidatus Firestonebacteria bacterium]|nr:DUF2007 domain-containing protein [Candidatus Firestonebacteria bacterium]